MKFRWWETRIPVFSVRPKWFCHAHFASFGVWRLLWYTLKQRLIGQSNDIYVDYMASLVSSASYSLGNCSTHDAPFIGLDTVVTVVFRPFFNRILFSIGRHRQPAIEYQLYPIKPYPFFKHNPLLRFQQDHKENVWMHVKTRFVSKY